MKRLALVVVCTLGCVARASSPIDEATQSLQEAQRANDEGPPCTGLSTKLKLSVEALEQARKAPSRVGQARGRLEVAKDFASKACAGSVQEKVTRALTSALAALAKGEPAHGPEKKGADFNAACRTNDECASDHCFVGADGQGYCSKACETASACPTNWSCRRPGSAAQRICIQ